MKPATQIVYDTALATARKMGAEGLKSDDIVMSVINSPEVTAVLPKWGVGDLPATALQDIKRAYREGAQSA